MATQKRGGLGKGLAALFEEANTAVPVSGRDGGAEKSDNTVRYIDIDEIKPNSMQPRTVFDEESIEQLAASIKQHGVIQPVMLCAGKNGYDLVAGERRWRAARKAGLREVPAIIRNLSEEESALFAIIENVQREDLSPLEEAQAFHNMIELYGLTQQQLSESVGKSRPAIANALRLLKLPEKVRELVASGALTAGHANAIGGIQDTKQMISVAQQIAREGLSVRDAERLAAKVGGENQKKRRAVARKKNEETRAIEEELTGVLGTRVTVESNGKNGYIGIHYYNRDQLEGIIEELRGIRK